MPGAQNWKGVPAMLSPPVCAHCRAILHSSISIAAASNVLPVKTEFRTIHLAGALTLVIIMWPMDRHVIRREQVSDRTVQKCLTGTRTRKNITSGLEARRFLPEDKTWGMGGGTKC